MGGDRGEMSDRLTSCTILNKSWTDPLAGPNPYSPQENSLFVFVEQAQKPVLDNSVQIFRSSEIVTFELVARFDSHF